MHTRLISDTMMCRARKFSKQPTEPIRRASCTHTSVRQTTQQTPPPTKPRRAGAARALALPAPPPDAREGPHGLLEWRPGGGADADDGTRRKRVHVPHPRSSESRSRSSLSPACWQRRERKRRPTKPAPGGRRQGDRGTTLPSNPGPGPPNTAGPYRPDPAP